MGWLSQFGKGMTLDINYYVVLTIIVTSLYTKIKPIKPPSLLNLKKR